MGKKIIVCIFLVLGFSLSAAARVPEGDLLQGVTPGPDGKIDILTVFAHQDDESIYGGGAVLKALEDPRVRLHILCLTFDQTSDLPEKFGITADQYGRVRVKELETAAAVYGAVEVIQFRYASHTPPQVDPEKLIAEIKDAMERTGAEIVLTHDPAGFTGHMDHLATSRAATEAFKRSQAQVLYYPTLPLYLYRPFLYYNAGRLPVRPAKPDFRVEIKAEKKLKRMACYSHASQMRFTSVGTLTNFFLIFDHEYFSRGPTK